MGILRRHLDKPPVPFFGTVFLICVFLLVEYYASHARLGPVTHRDRALSILGFLPDWLLFSPGLFRGLQVIVLVAVPCWLLHVALPVSPWVTLVGFSVLMCQTVESSYYTRHTYHIANVALLGAVLWYSFAYRELGRYRTPLGFFRERCFPYWVYFIPFFYLATTYTLSGLTKLHHNGLEWMNGTSLQLWVATSGGAQSWPGHLILASRPLAMTLQGVMLLFETTAIASLFVVGLRPLYGVVFFAFHVVVERIFHLGFYGNIVMVLLLFVAYPLFALRADAARAQARSGQGRRRSVRIVLLPATVWRRIRATPA